MAKVLTMKNGVMCGHFTGKKSFDEIKIIKEGNGALCYELSDVESLAINNGGVPSVIGGAVTVAPASTTWLNSYKAQKIQEQKVVAKNTLRENEFDATNSEVYKATLKSYFINTVKAGIEAAVNKTVVDDFIETIVYPSP